MKFLLDTNVLIDAEPTAVVEVGRDGTALAIELIGLANEHGHLLRSHPATYKDLERKRDPASRALRRLLVRKYPPLQSPPPIQRAIIAELGTEIEGSNGWVDQCMIAALIGKAADFLVTNDESLRRRSGPLGLGDRAMSTRAAIAWIRHAAPVHPAPSSPLPLIHQMQAQQLDIDDRIFVSVRNDYSPYFDEWFEKCQSENRTCWVINDDGLAAVTIVKDETPADFNLPGKTLKVCLFKVAEPHAGMRYGELLLKAVLDYGRINEYETAYVTAFPKYEDVSAFFPNFGFTLIEAQSKLKEHVFVKSLTPSVNAASLPALDYHIAYGPYHYKTSMPAFIIPIQPTYHDRLFPEANRQLLPERNPFGNGIRKAYLCNAGIRSIVKGSVLYFYRSQDWHAITVVGVVEETVVSSDPSEIARHVGRRTVYSAPEIDKMAANGEVLAILFRQARVLEMPIHDRSLQQAKVWKGPPQSIMRLRQRAVEWIEERAR